MKCAALLAAALLTPGAPPASIDLGSVELGGAALRMLALPALSVSVSGAGFSATRTKGGVLLVFEPYELHEEATGALTLRLRSGFVRIALRGHGIDTIPPSVSVETPRAAVAGRPLTIRFAATDNDLVRTCTLKVTGRVIARLSWPVSTFRWQIRPWLRGAARITVTAVDRAGNRASATSKAFPIR
ncbi:MAG: hypothetical protein M3P18_08140 [Actinomycetota bacterium]|nr:hypothetical protein [Actinomycetota bacterium]